VGQAPPGLQLVDQTLEGQVLVSVGGQAGFADPLQQLREPGIAAQVGAEHEGVHEQADQALDLPPAAACDGGADQQIVLSGVAVEDRLECGDQRHEERGSVGEAEVAQGLGGRRAELPSEAVTLEPLDGRPRTVGRQLEHRRCAGEAVRPERELTFEDESVQPPALPGREVGVLHWQVRQDPWLTRREAGVQLRHLAMEDAHRPAVADDVVDGGED
jgi:hypothetical protein